MKCESVKNLEKDENMTKNDRSSSTDAAVYNAKN